MGTIGKTDFAQGGPKDRLKTFLCVAGDVLLPPSLVLANRIRNTPEESVFSQPHPLLAVTHPPPGVLRSQLRDQGMIQIGSMLNLRVQKKKTAHFYRK